jgi:hypothetical protein
LRPSFYNFIFTFPEFTFHDFSQAPHFKWAVFSMRFFYSRAPDTNSIIQVFNLS